MISSSPLFRIANAAGGILSKSLLSLRSVFSYIKQINFSFLCVKIVKNQRKSFRHNQIRDHLDRLPMCSTSLCSPDRVHPNSSFLVQSPVMGEFVPRIQNQEGCFGVKQVRSGRLWDCELGVGGVLVASKVVVLALASGGFGSVAGAHLLMPFITDLINRAIANSGASTATARAAGKVIGDARLSDDSQTVSDNDTVLIVLSIVKVIRGVEVVLNQICHFVCADCNGRRNFPIIGNWDRETILSKCQLAVRSDDSISALRELSAYLFLIVARLVRGLFV